MANGKWPTKIICTLLLLPLFGAPSSQSIDAIFRPLIDTQSPGAAVMLRQNGHTLLTRCYGVSNLKTQTPIGPHTNFRLASFTKQFTAMAIMLLVHDGKLRYDQTLTDLFPAFPAYGRSITIRQLLTHTSGLPDYEDLMGSDWPNTRQINDADVLALLAKQTHGKFEPGDSWAYSNSGYVVLGLIVAKISGMPYPDFLRQRIFEPLKMSRTIAYVNGASTVPNRAYGYSKNNGVFEDTDQSSTSATLGDGGVYSNLDDLTNWGDALRASKLLPKSEMSSALDPVKLKNGGQTYWPKSTGDSDNLAPGKPVAYGFGWFLSPVLGHPCMWHTGSTSGFRTIIERFVDNGKTLVILLNRTDFDPQQLATQINP